MTIAPGRLAFVSSHPIQYYTPLFRELARHTDLTVLFCHRQTAAAQAEAGFGVPFEWDIDLLSGYSSEFLENVSRHPDASTFRGCDTPGVRARLAQGQFDAVIVAGWYLKAHLQTIVAARRLGIPVMVRGDSRLGTPRTSARLAAKKLLYPALLRQFAACLYVGRDTKAYYEHYGVPDECLFFSPHCVDNARFAAAVAAVSKADARCLLGLREDAYLVLFAGKLLPRKRPLDLVNALASMARENVQLVIAGDGPLRADIEAAARGLHVDLVVLGFKNQSEMPIVYKACDVMVLPSEGSETWGLVANEALACGTPVVVSDACGCARDLAQDDEAGRVYPVGEVQALAGAIASVRFAPPTATAVAARIDCYSVERASTGVLDAFRAVTNARD